MSHEICGSDHWFVYCGSFGVPAVSRGRSSSTERTFAFCFSAATSAAASSPGKVAWYSERIGVASPGVPPAFAISAR